MQDLNDNSTASKADLSDQQLKSLLRASGRYSWEPELSRVLGELRSNPPATGDSEEPTRDDARATVENNTPRRKAPPARLDPLQISRGLATLSSYRVVRELGRGAMGFVLLARDDKLDRDVAIKVLRPDRDNSMNRQRFVREARAAAGLSHDHVVAVHGVDEPEHGLPYIVMNYVDGMSLAQLIRRDGPLQPASAAEIARQISAGLHAAHRKGLVHRDVKPGNVLIENSSGRAKITDFGLVRVSDGERFTRDEVVPGTPEYMSPEQIERPSEVDARSDVYSLGVTLYEMLTSETPFRGQPHMIVSQVLNEMPTPPRVLNDAIPTDLQNICLKAMDRDPRCRYASAAEMGEDLTQWSKGKPVKARPIGPLGKLMRWTKRHPSVAALSTAVLVVSAIGLAAVLHQWHRAEQNLTRFQDQQAATQRMSLLADQEKHAAQQARGQVISAVVSQQVLRNPSPGRKELTQQIVRSLMSSFESGLEDYKGTAEQRPELAGAHLAVAWASRRLDDPEKALHHYQQAEAVYAQLADENPAQPRFRQFLGTCWHNMGELHTELGEPQQALATLDKAMAIRAQLVEETPPKKGLHFRLDLATTRIAMASCFMGDRKERAVELLSRAGKDLQSLHSGNDQQVLPQFRWQRAQAYGKLGDAWVKVERPAAAIFAYERAVVGPHTDITTLESVAQWNAKAAELYNQAERHDKAKMHWNRAYAFQRRVVAHYPQDTSLQSDLQKYQRLVRRHNGVQTGAVTADVRRVLAPSGVRPIQTRAVRTATDSVEK